MFMRIVHEYPKMALYRQNGEYIARVRLKGGERHSKSFAGMDADQAHDAALEWYKTQPWASGVMIGDSVSEVMESYIASIRAQGFPPNTVATYESCVRCYIVPNIGSMAIRDVKPYTIESMYNVLMLSGASNGGGISPNTVAKLHGMLKGAFGWAKRMGIIKESPMDDKKVTRPRSFVDEATSYTEDEMAMLSAELEMAMDDDSMIGHSVTKRNAAFAAYLSLSTGMRCGEVCALKGSDIVGLYNTDADGAYIHVAHTAVHVKGKGVVRQERPKNKPSIRNVSITKDIADVIIAHQLWNVDRLGPDALGYPLCTVIGGYMAPSSVSREFTEIRKDLDLPSGTSFHTLRHTHATWLLMNGIDIKTIQERLGHAKIETTLEIYSHVLPGRDLAAARAFASLFKGTV